MPSAGRILIMPKGDYKADTQYEMLDLVSHNGTAWLAKRASKGIEPSANNTDDWMLMFDVANIGTRLSNVESALTRTRTDLDLRTNSRLFFNWDDGGALQVFIDGTYYGTVAFVDKP